MKDVHVGNIKPIAEPRSSDKPRRKEQAGGQNFSKTLKTAVSQMNEAAKGANVQPSQMNTSSIREEYSTANEQFTMLMRAEQNLRQLHRMITQKSEDNR